MNPYLTWSIILGVVWFILYLNRKDLRFKMLFSSFIFLPFGLTQPLFVPEYWNPEVLFKIFGLFDIESFLWCFFSAGIAAVLYSVIFKKKQKESLLSERHKYHTHVVYLLVPCFAAYLFCMSYFTEFSVLRSSFIFGIIAIIYFIYIRRDLLEASFMGGLSFMVLYIVSLLFVDVLFPGFIENQWTIEGVIGIKLFSVFIEEYIYAFLFGVNWSILFEEIKNLKLEDV